ncbi:MAG: ATP-binding protein [Elusimicrobiota bacterium]|jgi:predicted AAA+ superfamily ATPase|nr:ATP-binding protein [Elusimicrobiota bacterium]
MKYIPREIEPKITAAVKYSPVIAVTGPRQTGKSTMLKHLFPKYSYISFDSSDLRASARNDPQMFVENLKKPVIIDEIQYVPEIIPYIKIYVDNFTTALKNEEIAGKFILTGSQAFTMMAGLTESLAGRIALFELLPFSFSELNLKMTQPLSCYKQLLRGFYPLPNASDRESGEYYGDYLSTYIERDVRQILNIKDIGAFQTFVQVLAARTGSMLNIANIARDCSISHATAKNWLSILTASRIIYLLEPYFRNITKRVVKTPKVYFTDTGLLAHLLRYKDAETLISGPMSGNIFENMVIMEAVKNNNNAKKGNHFYFYRDNNGVETDLIIEGGQFINLYEIKASKTLKYEMAKNLSLTPIKADKKFVLSFNENSMPLGNNITAILWSDFSKTFD